MKKILILFLACVSFVSAQENNEAAIVVQKQLEAYNARDIDAFLATFSDDIVFFNFPKEETFKGITQLREVFGNLFKNSPDLYCYIKDVIATDDMVIVHEKVRFRKNQVMQDYIAMYKVSNGKITELYFLDRPQ